MSTSLFDLSGKVVLITGSSGGLGYTIATGLAEAGATMVLNGRDTDKLAGAVSSLSEQGHTVHGYSTDWAKHNIQVNAIGPGYFITELTQVLADDLAFDAWVKSRTPAARWGDPKELIGAAIFLSSAASDFVNGQVIYVDGGMLASL